MSDVSAGGVAAAIRGCTEEIRRSAGTLGDATDLANRVAAARQQIESLNQQLAGLLTGTSQDAGAATGQIQQAIADLEAFIQAASVLEAAQQRILGGCDAADAIAANL